EPSERLPAAGRHGRVGTYSPRSAGADRRGGRSRDPGAVREVAPLDGATDPVREPGPRGEGVMGRGWASCPVRRPCRPTRRGEPMTADPFTDAAEDRVDELWPYAPAGFPLPPARRMDRRIGFRLGAQWARAH